MRWAVAAIVGVLIAAAIAWDAGEQHRSNCIQEGRTSCSVLPWDNGKAKGGLVIPGRPQGQRRGGGSLGGGSLGGGSLGQ